MIHLFWAGKGWFVPAITFASCLAMELVVRAVYHDNTYYQTHGWPILVALFLAAILVQMVSRGWVYSRELRDVKTANSSCCAHNTVSYLYLCAFGRRFFACLASRFS
jgi:hypothetical protein